MKKIGTLILGLLLISIVSAKIIITLQPDEIYNLGDKINVEFYIEDSGEDFLEAYIDCENKFVIYKKFYNLNEREEFTLSAPAQETGPCRIGIEFNKNKEVTTEFNISDKINVEYSINTKTFLPSDKIIIEGTAKKANGEKVNGKGSLSIGAFINQTVDISSGEFRYESEIGSTIPPGSYVVSLLITEKKSSFTSFGTIKDRIEVKSKPSFIEIISEDTIKPPAEYKFKISLLNQNHKFIENETIIYKIFDPSNELFMEDSMLSGEERWAIFRDDAKRKGWKITAYFGNIVATKQFFMEENRKILINIPNNSNEIILKNVGNVEYEGVINVFFVNETHSETVPVNANLSVGESMKFPVVLKGVYNLTAEGEEFADVEMRGFSIHSEEEMHPSNVMFTGAAVGSSNGFNLKLTLIPLFLIIILSGIFFILKIYKNSQKTKAEIRVPVKIINKNELQSESQQLQLEEKRVYTVFFNFDEKHYIQAEKMISRKGYRLHRVNNSLSFIMFYGLKSHKNELKLISMIKELKSNFQSLTAIIHSEKFENKASSLKSAFASKEVVGAVSGIFISEQIYNAIKELRNIEVKDSKVFNLKERVIKLYELKN
jgi:hypothetical protein